MRLALSSFSISSCALIRVKWVRCMATWFGLDWMWVWVCKHVDVGVSYNKLARCQACPA